MDRQQKPPQWGERCDSETDARRSCTSARGRGSVAGPDFLGLRNVGLERLDIKHQQADPRDARHVSRLQPALFLRSCDDEGVHWHGDCIISAELLQLLLRLFYHPLIALLIQEGF